MMDDMLRRGAARPRQPAADVGDRGGRAVLTALARRATVAGIAR